MVRSCCGAERGAAPCCFGPGGRAAQPKPGHTRCSWCDPDNMQRACGSAGGRARLKQLLRNMTSPIRQRALGKIPCENYAAHFEGEFGPVGGVVAVDDTASQADSLEAELEAVLDELVAAEGLEADLGEAVGAVQPSNPDGVDGASDEEVDIADPQDVVGPLTDSPHVDLAGPVATAAARAGPDTPPARPPCRLRGKQPDPAALVPAMVLHRPAAAGIPMKRPAGRQPWPNERCPGDGVAACVFSTTEAGSSAGVHPRRGETACCFCSCQAFDKATQTPRPKIVQMLRKLLDLDPAIAEKALGRISTWKGDAVASSYRQKIGLQRPGVEWSDLLAHRALLTQDLTEEEQRKYEEAVRRDRRLVRRKVFFPDLLTRQASVAQEQKEVDEIVNQCGPIADLASNDCGLPAPTDPTARMVEQWCKQGSWAMCDQCHSLQPRALQPMDLKRAAKPTISAKVCTACRHGEYVPQLEDVPVPLRGLSAEVVSALRPLDIDTGVYQRAQYGYRIHSSMVTFAWAAQSVKDKIQALGTKAERRSAKAAFQHLLACRDSAYATFHGRHADFLRRHGADAEEKVRKRPLRFLEEEGLECAMWPHLYWHRNLCESVSRAGHEGRRNAKKRKARRHAEERGEDGGSATEETGGSESGEEGPQIEASQLGRVKRGFLRKVFSPIMGYSLDYELLHYVYDLSLWTTVGTKKNIARQYDIPLRLVLSACPWTPQYWRIRHQAVVDMQRQCGNAALFRTRAPYERTFPYHAWVLHEQRLAGCPRLHLAGPETLHQAHVLMELDKAFICGSRGVTGRSDRAWKDHLLAAKPNAAGGQPPQTVLSRVTRLEFQDGKRKRARQAYHGRGTTHSHSLEFLQNKEMIGLEDKIWAHVPPRESDWLLHGLVLDGQRDYRDSGVPVREEPSAWDERLGKALLYHSEEDKALHIRPFFPQTLGITKCHEDVQQPDGNGAVLRYVATYSLKFSDGMDREWLSDHASDYSVARRVLFSYHPLEPEMWLTLAQGRFPQVDYTGSLVELTVPLPSTEKKPKALHNYEQSTWRSESMSFLEFLRRANADGRIIRYIRDAHQQYVLDAVAQAMQATGMSDKSAAQGAQELLRTYRRRVKDEDGAEDVPELASFATFAADQWMVNVMELDAFANNYKPRGEKLVAAGTCSMLNDRYYGQWLVLRRPFRAIADLQAAAPQVSERVPAHYQNFALALCLAPNMWGDDAAIRAQMDLEAHSRATIDTILYKVRAQRSLVRRYLAGELQPDDVVDVVEDADGRAEGRPPQAEPPAPLTESQKRLRRAIQPLVERAISAAQAEGEDELEGILAQARDESKMLFASGPPGTGKTFVLHQEIRRWQARGARVLFVLPTGQLASEMRMAHPHIDVDTFHGGLWFHKDLSEALGILTQYDLVILDEISMLTAEQFDRLMAMWRAADKLPCMVLLGDFWQLPVMDKEARRCDESSQWQRNVKRQLKNIKRGHRAWTSPQPTAYDILQLLRAHPDTTIVTCARRAAALVNDLAVQVLFRDRHKRSLGTVPCDYEAKVANYTTTGQLRAGPLEAAGVDIFEGQRLFLTRNLDKENGFVNGMPAIVEGYDARSKCLHVVTKLGTSLAVHLYTEEVEGHGRVTYFPVRVGYAGTVQKIQGATLPHITVWLDRPGCRAAAYVALSRVQQDDHYALAGKIGTKHFIPAQ
eukprot:g12002.t1